MEIQYIGACALLARLSRKIEDEEDLAAIECALDECCRIFPKRFEYVPVKPRGFSLELVRSRKPWAEIKPRRPWIENEKK